jgi:lipopolysaccharide transport system ATP-binding protein
LSDLAIRLEGLGKKYRLGHREESYKTFRDALAGLAAAPWRRLSRAARRDPPGDGETAETLWALRAVSAEVRRGEVVGIIGRNGAGKSTVLKILSRITEPTEGFAEIRGSVGSLLEVGSGFHAELSGRENVFLNGAILGMKRAEILRKFDEIVAFAEIDQFIDMPVKRYSSGMYVRLAFAVAAHLEPDILIVDEVLAVGDLEFQRKCLGKLHSVSGAGRTVIFVSHNTGAIKRLCNRCIFLEKGSVLADGPTDTVVELYVNKYNMAGRSQDGDAIRGEEDSRFVLVREEGRERIRVFCGEPLALEFTIEAPMRLPSRDVGIGLTFVSNTGEPIVSMSSLFQKVSISGTDSRSWRIHCELGRIPLHAGTYYVTAYLGNGESSIKFPNAMTVEVLEHDVFGSGRSLPGAASWGPMYWAPRWEIQAAEAAVASTQHAGGGSP